MNLDPQLLAQILGLRNTGQYSDNPNVGGPDFWEQQGAVGNNNYRLYSLPSLGYTGNGDSQTPVELGSQDSVITKVREDTGGRLGDWWNTDGTYGGTFAVGGPMDGLYTAIALMLGGYLGGTALSGAEAAGLSGLDAAMVDAGAGATNVGAAGGAVGGAAGGAGAVGGGAGAVGGGAGGLSGWDAAMVDAGAGATNVGGASAGSGFAGLSSADKAALYGSEGYGASMSGAETSAFDKALTMKNVKDGVEAGLGLSDLAKLGLAGMAAYDSRDQQSTSSRDPWGPAQPYLRAMMADGASLYDRYKNNPFSEQQKTAYNNLGGLLNTINSNAGGLLSGFQANASGANNYDRSNPRRQLTGSTFDMGQFMPGLLNFFKG